MAVVRLLLVWCVFCTFCHFPVESTFPVPVFIWSKESSLTQSTPSLAGHTLSAQDFLDRYLKNVLEKPQIVCLFIQDRLSLDDITRYGDAYSPSSHGSFNNLKLAMDAANSTVVLPSVDATFDGLTAGVVEYIKKHIQGQVINIKSEDLETFAVEKYTLDNKVTNVFVIHLYPVEFSSSANAGLAFTQNDNVMASITKQIATLSPSYTFILTGEAPSKIVNEQQLADARSSLPHDRLRRDVSAAAGSPNNVIFKNGTLFVNGRCIFMFMDGIIIKTGNISINVLNTTSVNGTVSSMCSNFSVASLDLTLQFEQIDYFKLSAVFNRTRRDWYCVSISIVIKGSVDGKSVNVDQEYPCTKQIQVPIKMCYHCHNSTFGTNSSNAILFSNFQVQPYAIKNGQFSYAYDCVGFFTIPILMGLLTAGILLLILFFGIMAVFSITTMDRFDDPKGPGISFGTTTG